MKALRGVLALCAVTLPLALSAAAPDQSLRPSPRVADTVPDRTEPAPQSVAGLEESLRPTPRPRVRVVTQSARVQTSAAGSVCGDPAIKGVSIPAIRGRGQCGVANPVRVASVDGVGLSQRPTIDCRTAQALKSWVKNGLKPAVGRVGGGVRSLTVVSHYACRNRNNAKTGRLSEHAKGRAVDISAINLNNGQTITVLKGWPNRQQGRILRQAHRAACGPFGTVLGPEANRFHLDHFHFDTARYRSGPFCR